MLKSSYQRVFGQSSATADDNDEQHISVNYGSVPVTREEKDDSEVPASINVKARRASRTWDALKSSIIHTDGRRGSLIPEFVDIAESVFSDIRSESEESKAAISNEAEEYGLCNAYQRAFPERSFALFVTLIFELPTLFMISGGSDRLCGLIGRKKYTTLMALLPIISAVSGNVGLQASTLTTRAVSHGQVRVDNFQVWLKKEITAAAYLGAAMGLLSAGISFFMGGWNFPFAVSIFTAQWIGIFTAGCTGTLAPLLFTFIFDRDSGKWGGPLETAVQDVVGSFAMIVVTYWIMSLFGPYDLDSSDMC